MKLKSGKGNWLRKTLKTWVSHYYTMHTDFGANRLVGKWENWDALQRMQATRTKIMPSIMDTSLELSVHY